jgi:hypothetical protein
MTLSSVTLTNCFFYGAHGLDRITVESRAGLPEAPKWFRTARRCVADEFEWRQRNARWRAEDWKLTGLAATNRLSATQVALVYRGLRMNLESRGDQPGAADFYYGEMEMRRHDPTTPRAERFLLGAYWLTSSYGLRAFRSLAVLVAFLVIGALGMRTFGLRAAHPTAAQSLLAAAQSIVPGVAVQAHVTDAGAGLDLGLTVVGPLVLGLIVLSVRNRLRR